jgi:hypothetical protein
MGFASAERFTAVLNAADIASALPNRRNRSRDIATPSRVDIGT